jgi:hypothetical protein
LRRAGKASEARANAAHALAAIAAAAGPFRSPDRAKSIRCSRFNFPFAVRKEWRALSGQESGRRKLGSSFFFKILS